MIDSLGDRMKDYERAARGVLPRRMPVIVRVDGKAFHTFTRGLSQPFDGAFIAAMNSVAVQLCEEMQGAVLAYVQSDEVSVFLHNYKRLQTGAWFDNEIQKIVSVSAALAAARITRIIGREAAFDSRVFVLPEAEVCNYFVWRQQDATRNSIQMVARSLYSHGELHEKNTNVLQEMIFAKGINWNDYPVHLKRGRCVVREMFEVEGATRYNWIVDNEIPVFARARDYIEHLLEILEET